MKPPFRAPSMPPEGDARRGYQPLLEELFDLYPRLVRGEPAVRIRDGYRQVTFLAHGWYLRCHRGIESVLLLDAAAHAEEAAPIRRSIIEHVVALRWLAAEGDRILDTVARGHARETKRRGDAVAAAKWTSVDHAEFQKVIADIDPDSWDAHNDYLLHFDDRMKNYADEHARPGYLAELGRTHAGYESAASYVDLDDGGFLVLPRDPIWQVPFSTSHLLEALLSIREVFEPKPWEKELEQILERYGAVNNADRKQQGLQPVDWSTGELVTSKTKASENSSVEGDDDKGT